MDQGLLGQHQIQQMLDENEGKYEGSQLQEMLNQLIEHDQVLRIVRCRVPRLPPGAARRIAERLQLLRDFG